MEEWSAVGVPTGTVTFLLTDIEGSTRQWEEAADEMAAAVSRHYEVLDKVVTRWEGVRPVEQGEGDSTVSAFARASDAIAAALDAQRALAAETPQLRVRMAVHTGEAQLRDGDNYVGPAIIRCARLRSSGHGGQVLVSGVSAALVADRLPDGVGLLDLGTHRLRDLVQPEHVWQLTHAELAGNFPPLRSLDEFRHNLPRVTIPLIGRVEELAELHRLVDANRVVTITGVGGVGKTSLAMQVGADLVTRFPDGVWWVELAAVTDLSRVAPAVLTATGGREVTQLTAEDTIVANLGSASTLVVLDNCEHLVDGVAAVVHRLSRDCPGVHVLATSREPLGVGGETTWRTPSLAVPEDGNSTAIASYDAVSLFVERATRVRPNFAITSENAAAIARICQRLDGIPLAIELAAARVRALPVERLEIELDQRFRLLTGGARTALARQRTLVASVDWSYDLLDEQERTMLRRLSAFVGGFTLDAAEAVCTSEDLDTYDVLDVLTRLVDKNLVQVDEEGRYRLLETIRHYAMDKARETGDLAESRDRHLAWCLDLTCAWDVDHCIPTIGMVEGEIEPEYANLLTALDWSVAVSPAIEILGPLALLWNWRSRFAEMSLWSDRVLAKLEPGSPPWIKALAYLADAGVIAGAPALTLEREPVPLEAAQRAGDDWATARLLIDASLAATMSMPSEGLRQSFEHAALLAMARGDDATASRAIGGLAVLGMTAGRPDWIEEALGELASWPLDDWLFAYLPALGRGAFCIQMSRFDDVEESTERNVHRVPPTPATGLLVQAGWSAFARADRGALDALLAQLPTEHERGVWGGYCVCLEARRAVLDSDRALAEHHLRAAVEKGFGGYRTPFLLWDAAYLAVSVGADDLAASILRDPFLDEYAAGAGTPESATDHEVIHALLALSRDEELDAERWAHAALERRASMTPNKFQALEVLACISGGERGVRLSAASRRHRDATGHRHRPMVLEQRLPITLSKAREDLGASFDEAWEEGYALTLEEAYSYALRMRGERKRPAHGWSSLTPTERDVVNLVAEGLSNPQIAGRLMIETSTVKTHLHHVFTKLGVTTRAELAAEAVRRGAARDS